MTTTRFGRACKILRSAKENVRALAAQKIVVASGNLIVFGIGQVRNRPMRAALFGPGNRNNGLLFLEQTRKNEAPDHAPHPETIYTSKLSAQNSLLTDGNNLK